MSIPYVCVRFCTGSDVNLLCVDRTHILLVLCHRGYSPSKDSSVKNVNAELMVN